MVPATIYHCQSQFLVVAIDLDPVNAHNGSMVKAGTIVRKSKDQIDQNIEFD